MKVAATARTSELDDECSPARFTEFLAHEFPMLRCYLGEIQFRKLANANCAEHPAHFNMRWLSQHLADYLQTYKPLKQSPEVQELSTIEAAMNFAFDAPVATTLPQKVLRLHPSTQMLVFKQNTTSIWSALKCDAQPPKPHLLDAPQNIVVWRQGQTARFRLLGDEEAASLKACKTQGNFAAIVEALKHFDKPETAATRAGIYLRGWIEAEMVVGLAPLAEK